jgi:hypothetical protein
MSNNFFEDESDDFGIKPVDRIVFRPAPIDAPELPKAKRIFDPAPRPRPQPLDVPNATEWIPGEKNQKKKKNQPDDETKQHWLNAFSFFGKTLSALVVLGVLAGIGFFVYWIISQYNL